MIAAVATPGLEFFEAEHEYRLNGVVIPSVTQVLKDNRLSSDFAHVRWADLERARQLGYAVHVATHYHDEGTLDESTIDAEVLPYLEAWRAFVRDRGLQFEYLEQLIADPTYLYAGTIDRIARAQREAGRGIIDLKTGDPKAAAARYQTAGYKRLAERLPGEAPRWRWSVQLHPDRTVPYTVTPYTGTRDWRIFQSALELTHERAALGKSWREAA